MSGFRRILKHTKGSDAMGLVMDLFTTAQLSFPVYPCVDLPSLLCPSTHHPAMPYLAHARSCFVFAKYVVPLSISGVRLAPTIEVVQVASALAKKNPSFQLSPILID